MTEEKKEVAKEQSAPAPAAAPEAPAVAPTAPAPSAVAPAVKETKEAKPKVEKPSNCSSCNKSIKKKRWYYRNGKFFCTKRCWTNATKKDEKKESGEGEKK